MRFRTFGAYQPMFFRNAEGGGSGDGDSTTTDTTGDKPDNSNDVQALIAKAVAEAVEQATTGLKKKNEELIGKEKRLKEALDAAKSKPTLTDEEYTEFKTLKERIERDELLKAFAEGKSDEVIDRLTKRTRLDMEAKVAAEAEAKAKAAADAETWRARYEQTLISNEVTKAAATAVKPQYVDLVNRLVAERIKIVDGAVRVVNAEGEVEMNAAGTKPLGVGDLIESLRSTYTDLFLVSSGGGAGGSTKRATGTSTKLSMEMAAELPPEEYFKLRREGKI